MRVAILGATKGMGRSLARLMAARGDAVCLLGRSEEALQRSSEDLKAHGASRIGTAFCSLDAPETFEPALLAAEKALDGLDAVVVTAGVFATQAHLEANLELTRRMLTVNFTNTIVFCEHARRRLLARGGGTLCIFSSVAGDRGRKPVILYGAAKSGLSTYLEGLDHKFRRQGLLTVCVKPGFVRTSMTEGLPTPPFAGEPDAVAARVLAAIDAGTPVVYAPAPWRFILGFIRLLPRWVMRRIEI